jgi:hypothetical protein
MEHNTYVVRAEGGKFSHIFRDNGFVGIGWFDNESAKTFDITKAVTRTYIKEKLMENNTNFSNRGLGQAAGMSYRFINEVKIGDKVLSPTYNNKVMIGTITSDCYVSIDDKYEGILRRDVSWSEDVNKELLSEEIKQKFYCNSTFFAVDEEMPEGSTESESFEDEINQGEYVYFGYTYFMKSKSIPNIYKIGKADDVEKREKDLTKDSKYGVFNLTTLGWVKVKNPYKFEKLFHTYFQDYRLSRKNGIEVDTELFLTEKNLYEMWKKFVQKNYLEDENMKSEVIEYWLS